MLRYDKLSLLKESQPNGYDVDTLVGAVLLSIKPENFPTHGYIFILLTAVTTSREAGNVNVKANAHMSGLVCGWFLLLRNNDLGQEMPFTKEK